MFRNSVNFSLQDKTVYQSHPDPGRYLSLYHWRRCQCESRCDSTAAYVVHILDCLA